MRFFFILMLLGAACAWADGVVTGVKLEAARGGVRLRLAITRAVHYRTRVLSRNLLAIDVSPARLGPGLVTKVPIQRGLLRDATVRQLDANTVRLQVSAISLPTYRGWADAREVTMQLSTATMAPAPWSARRWPRHPAPPGYTSQKRLTLDFVQADLVDVVKVLAKQMGRNVYIGPGVEGSVTVSLIEVPAQAALAMILPMQENELAYKLVGANTLIVAASEKDAQIQQQTQVLLQNKACKIRPTMTQAAIARQTAVLKDKGCGGAVFARQAMVQQNEQLNQGQAK